MIKTAKDYPISQLLDVDANLIYVIPKYQREYSWGKRQWEVLFDDLLENDRGYFLGSIICINYNEDALEPNKLELVDGQQRMATLSILLASIYKVLDEYKNLLDEDQKIELINIKHKLILKRRSSQYRLVLQIQNNNQSDYISKLSSLGIGNSDSPKPYAGNRKIYLAFSYFYNQLMKMSEDGNNLEDVLDFYDKVLTAIIVKIEVDSHAGAYTLFESLNNRGLPLTPIDIIKNKLFSALEKNDNSSSTDVYLPKWNKIITLLGEDYSNQERFLRHYYNAFRDDLREVSKVAMAKRSNLILIYEKLIDYNPEEFLDKMIKATQIYSFFIFPENFPEKIKFIKPIQALSRIQGTPSYILLLNLFKKQNELSLSVPDLIKIINLLSTFFVRRNITDSPPTRDLTQFFMKIIDEINSKKGNLVVQTIGKELSNISTLDGIFIEKLNGPIYDQNIGATRFLLCSLEEQNMTKETFKDLWAKKGKAYTWTIEHVFPQNPDISSKWVQTVAAGNREVAMEVHQTHLHKLGNLTLSGYNSSLGTLSLKDKRDKKDNEGRYIGYKNGLYLNSELKDVQTWTAEEIEKRTNKLVEKIVALFSYSRYV